VADRNGEIERRLAEIERRLQALEHEKIPSPSGGATSAVDRVGPRKPGGDSLSSAAAYLGRVLLIFGGAYLLRAITDFGFVSVIAGIPIGAGYALLWLFMGYRAGARSDERVRAGLYSGLSVILFLPLLVEAATRFGLLSPLQSAVALVAFAAMAMAVAVLRRLRVLAWLTLAGTVATALMLFQETHAAVIFSFLLLLLGAGSLWCVYLTGLRGIQWVGALGADTAIVLLAAVGMNENWPVQPTSAYFFGLAVWTLYLASAAVRSHVLRHEPGLFEFIQIFAATAVVSAVTLAMPVPASYLSGLGGAALLIGLSCYALGFLPTGSTAVSDGRGPAYYLYTTLALVLVIGGSALVLPAGPAAVLLSLFALATARISGRQRRVAFSLQATVFLGAAAVLSGGLAAGLGAFTAEAAGWPSVTVPQVIVAAAAVACLFIPVAQRSKRWGLAAGLPQLIVLVLSICLVGGLTVAVVAPAVAHGPGGALDPGMLAALRTAILAAASVVLALSSRYRRWPEARWLAYPVLAVTGAKLILEDFPHGRPLTLFMALGVVGVALIMVSRLLPRHAGTASPEDTEDAANAGGTVAG